MYLLGRKVVYEYEVIPVMHEANVLIILSQNTTMQYLCYPVRISTANSSSFPYWVKSQLISSLVFKYSTKCY